MVEPEEQRIGREGFLESRDWGMAKIHKFKERQGRGWREEGCLQRIGREGAYGGYEGRTPTKVDRQDVECHN